MAIRKFKDTLRALFGAAADSSHTDAKLAAAEAYKQTTVVSLMTSANAATNSEWQYFGVGAESNPRRVLGINFWPDAALDLSSDSGTNNAVIKAQKTDGAGGSATSIASVSTSGSAANFVVGIPYALTLSCVDLAAGDVVAVAIGKNGTGHAITVGRFEVITEAV